MKNRALIGILAGMMMLGNVPVYASDLPETETAEEAVPNAIEDVTEDIAEDTTAEADEEIMEDYAADAVSEEEAAGEVTVESADMEEALPLTEEAEVVEMCEGGEAETESICMTAMDASNMQICANDTYSTAAALTLGKNVSSTLQKSETKYYKFTTNTSGKASFSLLNTEISSVKFILYNSNQEQITYKYTKNWEISIAKGTYYLAVKQSSGTGSYQMSTAWDGAADTAGNDSFSTAKGITLGSDVQANVAENQKNSYYKFTLPTSGVVKVSLASDDISSAGFRIYGSSEKALSSTKYGKSTEFSMMKGTYYLQVSKSSGSGNGTLRVVLDGAANATGNTALSSATKIQLGSTVQGNLAEYADDSNDKGRACYKVTTTGASKINLSLSSDVINSVNYEVYNRKEERIAYHYSDKSWSTEVGKGTYYIVVKHWTGNYGNFKLTVKSAKVPVTKKTYVSSLKSNGSGSLTVGWKKSANADGYQIRYKVGSKTKTFTIKGRYITSKYFYNLKAGRKYISVRAYRKIDNCTIYSNWSKTKAITVRA